MQHEDYSLFLIALRRPFCQVLQLAGVWLDL